MLPRRYRCFTRRTSLRGTLPGRLGADACDLIGLPLVAQLQRPGALTQRSRVLLRARAVLVSPSRVPSTHSAHIIVLYRAAAD